jgi:hypothetical protein
MTADTAEKQASHTKSTYTPPPGHLGNLTPEQEAALAKISEELRAEGALVEARHDDATLLRCVGPLVPCTESERTRRVYAYALRTLGK